MRRDLSRARSAVAALVLCVAGMTSSACARHTAVSAFQVEVRIADRGIFVPLPPPSLRLKPVQNVQVQGTVEGEPLEDVRVRIIDTLGGGEADVAVRSGQREFSAMLTMDLESNCLSVWAESEDGEQGDPLFVHAEIVGDAEIATIEGCDVAAERSSETE